MPTDVREQVVEAFPELDRIADDELRAGVVDAWELALAENGVTDLAALPWFPPEQHELELPEERAVAHVRDVTQCAIGLAETLCERRGTDLSMDLVVAGALVHDISKPYEFDGMDETPTFGLLGHPYYGVHVVEAAGLPVELGHVVLSHTPRTSVEPATIEAELVRVADEAAAAAIRVAALDDLRDA